MECEICVIDVLLTNPQQVNDAIKPIRTKISKECFQHFVESMSWRIKDNMQSKAVFKKWVACCFWRKEALSAVSLFHFSSMLCETELSSLTFCAAAWYWELSMSLCLLLKQGQFVSLFCLCLLPLSTTDVERRGVLLHLSCHSPHSLYKVHPFLQGWAL